MIDERPAADTAVLFSVWLVEHYCPKSGMLKRVMTRRALLSVQRHAQKSDS